MRRLIIFSGLVLIAACFYFAITGRTEWIEEKLKDYFASDPVWDYDFYRAKSPAGMDSVEVVEMTSPVYHIRDIYKSMRGPVYSEIVFLNTTAPQKLCWITGYGVSAVEENGMISMSDDFICHNNLDCYLESYFKSWGLEERITHPWQNNRFVTMTAGQTRLQFPEGFAIPVLSDEAMMVASQVLNHNIKNPDLNVKHRIRIDFKYDQLSGRKYKPLMQRSAFIMRPVEGSDSAAVCPHHGEKNHSCCTPARSAVADNLYQDKGVTYTGHWVIPLGKEEVRQEVTEMLDLTFSTTLHYAGVHVHPFAESLELRDITADSTVFKASMKNYSDRIGLEKIDYFSSAKGIMLYKKHRYELVCVYNNTSGVEQDAMATMFLYLYDSELEQKVNEWRMKGGSKQ